MVGNATVKAPGMKSWRAMHEQMRELEVKSPDIESGNTGDSVDSCCIFCGERHRGKMEKDNVVRRQEIWLDFCQIYCLGASVRLAAYRPGLKDLPSFKSKRWLLTVLISDMILAK